MARLAPGRPQRLNETYAAKHADYLVVERDGEIIGDLMLRSGDGWGQREVKDQAVGVQAELGWTFAPEAGGKGYATEAVAALIGVCFEHLDKHRVEAGAFAANEPSWRLMERVGMHDRLKLALLAMNEGLVCGPAATDAGVLRP